MGHIRLPHDFAADPFPGICPFHDDCFEGLASGPAVGRRWGIPAEKIPPDHPAWPLEALYIAHALADFICTLSPRRIVMGGGVMEQEHLFPMVRKSVRDLLNGYIRSAAILDEIDAYIVPPALGKQAGVLGAIALAMALAKDDRLSCHDIISPMNPKTQ
jgi:fructokinase